MLCHVSFDRISSPPQLICVFEDSNRLFTVYSSCLVCTLNSLMVQSEARDFISDFISQSSTNHQPIISEPSASHQHMTPPPSKRLHARAGRRVRRGGREVLVRVLHPRAREPSLAGLRAAVSMFRHRRRRRRRVHLSRRVLSPRFLLLSFSFMCISLAQIRSA